MILNYSRTSVGIKQQKLQIMCILKNILYLINRKIAIISYERVFYFLFLYHQWWKKCITWIEFLVFGDLNNICSLQRCFYLFKYIFLWRKWYLTKGVILPINVNTSIIIQRFEKKFCLFEKKCFFEISKFSAFFPK